MAFFDFLKRTPVARIPAPDLAAQAFASRAMTGNEVGAMSSSIVLQNANSTQRKGAADILDMYRKSPALRSVSGHVASTVASVQWRLFAMPVQELEVQAGMKPVRRFKKADRNFLEAPFRERRDLMQRALAEGDMVEIDRHPFLELMDKPNALQRGKTARHVTIVSYDLVGEAGWVLDRSGPGDTPVRFWPVPGHWIVRRPTAEEPSWGINVGRDRWSIPVDSFVLFQDPDPFNPYGVGAGLGLTLADELDTDEGAAKTVNAFFQNSAMPNAIVSVKGANKGVLERMKSEWNNKLQGWAKAYSTHFVNSDLSVARLDTTFKDQGLVEIRKAIRDTCQQIWNVPPEKLGIITNSNRATAEAARAIDAEDVQVPRLEMMRQELQRIAAMFDAKLVVDYDSPVPADIEARKTLVPLLPGRFTVDEERAIAGLPPVADGTGSGYVINGKYYPTLTAMKPDIYAYHLGAGLFSKNEIRKSLGWAPMTFDDGEVAATPFALPGADAGTGDSGMLAAPKRLPATRAAGLSAADIKRIVNAIDYEALSNVMVPIVEKLMASFAQESMDAVADATGKDIGKYDDAATAKYVKNLKEKRIKDLINTTTKEALKSALIDAADAEDPSAALRDAVRSVFTAARVSRSQIIASTEAVHHSQAAVIEGFKQTGIVMKKEWISTRDGRARDSHIALDGQRVDLEEPFTIPSGEKHSGAKAQQPGGFGIAEEDINCRCATGTVIEDSGLSAEVSARFVAVLNPAADTEQRDDAWRKADAAVKRWEDDLKVAVEKGFSEQEKAVMEALENIIGG